MPPGAARPQRGKPSAYAIRLREKQKLRRLVSMAEKPFKKLVSNASKSSEASGTHLLRALDAGGQSFDLDADGLLAVCIQHEMDHLDGKVFVDYLSRLKQQRIAEKLRKQRRRTM